MVKAEELEIVIDEEGEVKIMVHGIKGKKCIEFSKFLEDSIGEVKERRKTSEFYEKEVQYTTYTKNRYWMELRLKKMEEDN